MSDGPRRNKLRRKGGWLADRTRAWDGILEYLPDEDAVGDAERVLAVRFPDEFRAAFPYIDSARPHPSRFWVQHPRFGAFRGRVDQMLSPRSDLEFIVRVTAALKIEGIVPDGVIPFGEDWLGNVVAFDLRTPTAGSPVVYVAHDLADAGIEDAIAPVAPSFTAFLDGLDDTGVAPDAPYAIRRQWSPPATRAWVRIASDEVASWDQVFQASGGPGTHVAANCPSCGAQDLHRYYRSFWLASGLNEPPEGDGEVWQWCAKCLRHRHAKARVPVWWRSDLPVDELLLVDDPDPLEDARQRRLSAIQPVKVPVVEVRSENLRLSGVRVDTRFVLSPNGEVRIVAPTPLSARMVCRHLFRLQDKDRWLTRKDGLRYLEKLRAEMRGTLWYATKVFEMDEDAAMTTPPLGYQP
jgi:hypothetical protein